MGYFYGLLAAFLFGANGSVSKVIIESGFSALQLTQMRVLGAAVISGLVLLIVNRKAFRLPIRQWPVILVLGVVGVGMLQATYAFAIELLPVGIALLLEYHAVLHVTLVDILFFKENVPPSRRLPPPPPDPPIPPSLSVCPPPPPPPPVDSISLNRELPPILP
jgi:drug/metabolite transporter (DMT)-like permease